MSRRGSKRVTGKNLICLKVHLKRGKRRAIANFEREFITHTWRCMCGLDFTTVYSSIQESPHAASD